MTDTSKTKFELTFPTGSFTHTDLAKLNNRTNQQVWTRYQAAVKSGQLIRDGERKPAGGKGKPSLLWKLNPNYVAPAPGTVVAPATPATAPAVDDNIVMPTEAQIEAAQAPTVSPTAPPAEPVVEPAVVTEPAVPAVVEPPVATAPADPTPVATETPAEPTSAAPTPEEKKDAVPPTDPPQGGTPVVAEVAIVTVEVARVEDTPAPAPLPDIQPVEGIATPAPETVLNDTCPACNCCLTAHNDATGVMVGCYQPKAVCPTTEPVEGHSTTIKGAVAILHDKWDKLVAAMKPVAA